MSKLSGLELVGLAHDWRIFARPEQLLPPGEWAYWLVMAGRGFGKTRTGAETVRQWVAQGHQYVNLIGATASDARDIMIEGESGILACCPPWERPEYRPSQCKLIWPNGAISLIFTADEPERLRGKQHSKLWADELAAWRYPESWDQANFGLRLGAKPQAVVTTTPRPTQLVRDILADPSTVVSRGTTSDNAENLAPSFLGKIVKKYEGTRLGRQELSGELLDDNPGALFKRIHIDANRVLLAPADMTRVVVAIDPAATSNEDSDDTGIVVAGIKTIAGVVHGYVLADLTTHATPEGWSRIAVKAYKDGKADRIVAEVNNGGDMVEAVIRAADPNVPYRSVRATRGKAIRAEPVAALYEQGRIHHVGSLPQLEDQMVGWDPTDTKAPSPDRMDAAVWALTDLMLAESNNAYIEGMRLIIERDRLAMNLPR